MWGGAIIVVAAATTVTIAYNLYIYWDLGEESWHFLRRSTEGLELYILPKGRRQDIPGVGEIA